MKYLKVIPYLVIIGLLIYIFSLKQEEDIIVIPSQENTTTITAPQPIVKTDTVMISDTEYKVVEVPNPVNKELLEKYNQAKDSISKLKLYKEAVTEREYKETLVDSIQTITVNSKVIGTLTEQIISYKTNSITIERKSLKSDINVYLGVITMIPTIPTNRLDIGGQINVKTKNQIYQLGYTANGSIIAGVSFKLF